MAVLNQNLNRAFVLFELTPTNEISLLDPYEWTLGKCCNDPLRPPDLSGVGRRYRLTFAAGMVQPGQSPFGE
jgi:hypothetical protein